MDTPTPAKKPKSGLINLAVDYGPLMVFFLVYRHYAPESKNDSIGEVFAVMQGTGAFIVAAIVALAVSKWRLGHI